VPELESFEEAVQRLLRSRAEQGKPATVTDPGQLGVIAQVLYLHAIEAVTSRNGRGAA